MRLADIIATLQAGGDPNQAVMQAYQPTGDQMAGIPTPMYPPLPNAAPPDVAPPVAPPANIPTPEAAAPPPPASTTPTGVVSPVTNPVPAPAAPTALQSPPDLANMYVKLMEKNQNAAALDSGLTLMAAGLSNNLTTRNALIQHAAAGGGKGAGGITSTDIINLQKQDQANKDRLMRQSLLGGLAKQYNLSPEAIAALESSGKLDEVIQAHSTGHLLKVTDAATGQEMLTHPITGKVVAAIGGKKPVETQFVDGQLRRKDTGEPVGPAGEQQPLEAQRLLADANKERATRGLPPLTTEEWAKIRHPQGTTVNVSTDGTVFQKPPEGYEYERTPDGKVKIGADGRPIMYSSSPKAKGEEKETAQDIADKERKAAEVLKKENKERVSSAFSASNVGAAVDTALGLANAPGATGTFAKVARTFAPVTGMAWDTIDAKLKTIDANNVVSALNSMRAASPSGGALGNVTESENRMLASIIGSTSPYQETGEFKKGLIRIKAAMMVMAEQKYDDSDGATRFQKDLKDKIDELSAAEESRGKAGTGVTIKPKAP